MAWKPTPASSWRIHEIPLGRGKEVFDAELIGACEALERAQSVDNSKRVTVLLDSQAAIAQLQHTDPGPGQALALRAHEAATWLRDQEINVTIQWVPAHAGVEGNEQADRAAKQAVLKSAPADDGISLAHVTRASTEAQSKRRKQ